MRLFFLILLSFCFHTVLLGQTHVGDTIYYSVNWQLVENKSESEYYKYTIKEAENKWRRKIFYSSNDQLKSDITLKSINPVIYDNVNISYHRNGQVSHQKVNGVSTSYYESGEIRSEFKKDRRIEYYQNGQRSFEIIHKTDTSDVNCRFWDVEGNPILESKTGTLEFEPDMEGNTRFIEFDNCKTVKTGYLMDGEEVLDANGSFIGGKTAYANYLRKNLKYPDQARRMGIEGKVYIQFLIEQDGSVVNAKVLRGISRDCDEEALRVISQSPAWHPATSKKKPIKQRFIIPIVFKLEGKAPSDKKKNKKNKRRS